MRTPMAAANWKCNTRLESATALAKGLREATDGVKGAETVLCPPFVYLAAVGEALSGSSLKLGSQDVHWEDDVAATGEIGPQMVAELAEYVIIGHSERRNVFGETDEWINKKLHAALIHGLKPIVCVGENLEQNKAGETQPFVGGQVRAAFAGITPEQARLVTMAYEPIWAIGTGLAATGENANEIIGNAVRGTLADLYGEDVAQAIRVQYGGSVKPDNVAEFLSQEEIDGALVGGASLKVPDFSEIVKKGLAAKEGP